MTSSESQCEPDWRFVVLHRELKGRSLFNRSVLSADDDDDDG